MPAIVQLKTKIKEQEEEIKMLKRQLEENERNLMRKTISMIHPEQRYNNECLLRDIKNNAKKFKEKQRLKTIFYTTILNSLVEAKQHLKPVQKIIKNEAVLALNNPYVQDIIREKEKLKLYIKKNYYSDLRLYDYIVDIKEELYGESYSGRINRIRGHFCELWEICRNRHKYAKQYHNTDEPVFSINEGITFRNSEYLPSRKLWYTKGVIKKIKKSSSSNSYYNILGPTYWITVRVGYDGSQNPIYRNYTRCELLKLIIK